jgi:L-amino acid N-acyltransferase
MVHSGHMGDGYSIRPAAIEDAEPIREIYNHEVEHTTATFDLVTRSLAEQREWLAARSGAFAAIVAVDDGSGEVIGFASLSPYKERAAYRTSVENSVYVRRDQHGKGVGKRLLQDLLATAASSGFHSVFARITPRAASNWWESSAKLDANSGAGCQSP